MVCRWRVLHGAPYLRRAAAPGLEQAYSRSDAIAWCSSHLFGSFIGRDAIFAATIRTLALLELRRLIHHPSRGFSGSVFCGRLVEFITRRRAGALAALCVCAFAAGLVYPVVSTWNKLGGSASLEQLTLDGSQYYRDYWPDQMRAVDWLKQQPLGVMVEAVSDTGGSYTTYASVSTFSGMPTVLGWIGHVAQWRGGYQEMGSRQDDIRVLYSTNNWDEARAVLDKYNIAYVYVGELEARTYSLDESKFGEHLSLGFESANARVYVYNPGK